MAALSQAGDGVDGPSGGVGFAPLRTGRLILRPLRAGDAPALHRLVNDWEVARRLARVPFPYPRALADEWIASTRREMAAGTAYHLAIVQAAVPASAAPDDAAPDDAASDGSAPEGAEGPLLGLAGVTVTGREGELGYWIGRRHWGQGYAPEAAGRLARWAMAHLPLDRLVADVLDDNSRSAAVLHRIGFVHDGMGERDFLARNARLPVVLFRAGRAELFAASSLSEAEAAADEGAPAAPPAAPEAAAGGTSLLLVAACALIDGEGRVLLARRPEGKPMAGLWEFPGGKLHPGETPEAALIRELREELGIDVSANCLGAFAFASHPLDGERHLLMPLYLCRRWEGTPVPREGQALAWVRPNRLSEYPMPPADKPLVALLRDFL